MNYTIVVLRAPQQRKLANLARPRAKEAEGDRRQS